jgi:transcriptional regulator with XRE-family HTH domain
MPVYDKLRAVTEGRAHDKDRDQGQSLGEIFAREVAQRRDTLGWSRAALERASGISEPAIEKLEAGMTGSPRRKTVLALARALETAGVWTVDEALALVGAKPLSPRERSAADDFADLRANSIVAPFIDDPLVPDEVKREVAPQLRKVLAERDEADRALYDVIQQAMRSA